MYCSRCGNKLVKGELSHYNPYNGNEVYFYQCPSIKGNPQSAWSFFRYGEHDYTTEEEEKPCDKSE